MSPKLYIKNMVCNRCIAVVNEEISRLGHNVASIELGSAEIESPIEKNDVDKIRAVLVRNGFELIDDKKSQVIDKIETTIIEFIHHDDDGPGLENLSDFLSKTLNYDYSYLSNLFSSVEGVTIEKYAILQRIEKVKEFLVYGELTLNEISFQMGYSSVQHLSNQFKKVTGLTPSHFKKIKEIKRKPLDLIGIQKPYNLFQE